MFKETMSHNAQAHRQASENSETPTSANACSAQRSCSPVGCMEGVEVEGLGKVEALIESYASKTKHGESLLHLLRKGEKTTLEVVTSIAIELWRKEFLREFISPPTSLSNPQALI